MTNEGTRKGPRGAAEPGADKRGFDARLAELEGIVAELEEGGLELEAAIERYQEGIQLLKSCHATLAGTRQRVEELTADAAGALQPLADDPDFEPGQA